MHPTVKSIAETSLVTQTFGTTYWFHTQEM